MISSVDLPIDDPAGQPSGILTVSCLPTQRQIDNLPPLLLDWRDSQAHDPITAPVQVLEEAEYSYAVETDHEAIRVEPTELFGPSHPNGLEGRLRPRQSTGTIDVDIFTNDGDRIGRCQLEVRARKLTYLSEYRWMLQRIANEATELLQLRFAPTSLAVFAPSATGDTKTTYQRFAFLRALLESEEFQGSLSLISNRPHHEYRPVETAIHPRQGLRPSRQLAQEISQPGRRFQLRPGQLVAGLDTLPEEVTRTDHIETLDTTPNRFVRFALERWSAVADEVLSALATQKTPAERRGYREATQLREELDLYLSAPLFTEVSALDGFPADNQVLQRQAGYRDVFRAFFQAEAASILDWPGGDDVFSAGQRDVATLYEYWIFLELARIIGDLDGFAMERRDLLKVTDSQMSLDLKKGTGRRLVGYGTRRGRKLTVELWFNKSFSLNSGSWSERLRPDCSVRITPEGGIAPESSTWLHFDAKYRIDKYTELLADDSASGEIDATEPAEEQRDLGPKISRPPADTILKMHAYRDAIQRSSGAYVLYPGVDNEPLQRTEYHEVLPGVGAFVLRPTEDGQAATGSVTALRRFLDDALDHVAAQGTGQERSDYWTQAAYQDRQPIRLTPQHGLTHPPADTQVLLGFVKSQEHWDWITRAGLYNLRADDRSGAVGLQSPELAADLVVLYGTDPVAVRLTASTGRLHIKTADELIASGYPFPGGTRYCCIELGPAGQEGPGAPVDLDRVLELTRTDRGRELWGAPTVVTWTQLVADTQMPT